jgi:hypothetical protein
LEAGWSTLAAGGLTYYPYFGAPLFSDQDLKIEAIRAWWAERREKCPQVLRLELVDAALEELGQWEGKHLPRSLAARMREGLPWVAHAPLLRESEDEWTGRQAFWKTWWASNRNKPLSAQWRSLFETFLTAFPEDKIPKSMDENWKAFTLTNERLMRLRDLAQRGTPGSVFAGPPGFEKDVIGGRCQQTEILKGWRDWWDAEKDRHVPELVKEAEDFQRRMCSCGKHR